jgi:hypothetical protein
MNQQLWLGCALPSPPLASHCLRPCPPPRLHSGADVWHQSQAGGRWDADEAYEGQIGYEWDRVGLHRMLTKIISAPQENNRRLPRLKVRPQPAPHLARCQCCCRGTLDACRGMAPTLWPPCCPGAPPARRSCCTTCRSSPPAACTRATSAWSWTQSRRTSWRRAWARARAPRPRPRARWRWWTDSRSACAPRPCAQATTCRWCEGPGGGRPLPGW